MRLMCDASPGGCAAQRLRQRRGDTDHRQAFLSLLFEDAARAKAAVLFVSHDLSLAPLFEQVTALGEINRAARPSQHV